MLAMHVAVWYQSCYYKIAASDSAIVFGTAKVLPVPKYKYFLGLVKVKFI